ncbi:hypothetical protein [uncultured Psychromonas sp.]|uniref:hypothetical protein n=1 Tax=uncultured Psychromonas sp. TaxID=173974 RepID=UPI00260DEBD8|nr:hypothetical protein [uncultured Psychromonas sp.]
MSQTTKQILALFKDDSFPSMVILDGEWGVGKTHYIKKELIPILEVKEKKVIFFSLTGLSNIDDFRDKLISSVYLSEKADQNFLDKLADSTFSILKNIGEDGGAIASILKGSTGAVKHAILNRIADTTVILDDLERVDNKELEKIIVGECLRLIEDKSLEFIFVMNGKKAKIDKAMVEKSFSDRVYFQRTNQEILKIVFQDYNYFDKYQHIIEKEVNTLDFTNLRALKRAANRLANIYKLITHDQLIDIDASMELIIESVLRISYLHYCLGKSSEEIIKGLSDQSRLDVILNPSNSKKDNQEDEFTKYRTINVPSKKIIEYCSGKAHLPPLINELGRLPTKDDPIDKLMFSRGYTLSEAEFSDSVQKLEEFIFEDINVPISKWFEACDFYIYLLAQEFIAGDKIAFLNQISDLCEKKNFDLLSLENRYQSLKINTQEILDKFNNQKEISTNKKIAEDNRLRFERIKSSWVESDIYIYKQFQHSNFINKYTSEQWFEVIKNWSMTDVGQFADFLSNRYTSINISDFLADEKNTLMKLLKLLESEMKIIPPSQKKGTLRLLINAVKAGIEKL